MKEITKELLQQVADLDKEPESAAYNIREDKSCAGRHSTENILIESKEDEPGLNIHIKPNTKNETVFIPALITQSKVDDLVYNDFFVGENADVLIVAGCGVHTDSDEVSQHNGIHRFFLEKNAKIKYLEKHIGTGEGRNNVFINPGTYVELGEGSYLEMDTSQIGGVDISARKTSGKLDKNATLVIKENILTEYNQEATTDFEVELNGENSAVHLMSRSVAKDQSHQEYRSVISGNNACMGHSECDAIIIGNGTVTASPDLTANHPDAMLIHEAAIGKIAGDQIIKLQTLGLTEEEAQEKIVQGFLK